MNERLQPGSRTASLSWLAIAAVPAVTWIMLAVAVVLRRYGVVVRSYRRDGMIEPWQAWLLNGCLALMLVWSGAQWWRCWQRERASDALWAADLAVARAKFILGELTPFVPGGEVCWDEDGKVESGTVRDVVLVSSGLGLRIDTGSGICRVPLACVRCAP